jgi:hypothetical protein
MGKRSDAVCNCTLTAFVDRTLLQQGFEVNGAVRRVPMEVRAEGDKDIQYGESLEEQGRFKAKPVLPFRYVHMLLWH